MGQHGRQDGLTQGLMPRVLQLQLELQGAQPHFWYWPNWAS